MKIQRVEGDWTPNPFPLGTLVGSIDLALDQDL